MKTRNSSGVGSKVDLDFDVNSLRITNSTQVSDPESIMTGSNMLAKIRNKNEKSGSSNKSTVSIGGVSENKKDLLKSLLGAINAKG